MPFQVVQFTVTRREHFESGRTSALAYLPTNDPAFPKFPTAREARLDWVRRAEPELGPDAPEAFLLRHWKWWVRNGYAKVVRCAG